MGHKSSQMTQRVGESSEERSARWRHVQSECGVTEGVGVGVLEEVNVVLHRSVGAVRRFQTRLDVLQTRVVTPLHLQYSFICLVIH